MQGKKLNPMLKAADLEEIADHLWAGISMVDAVHTAMTDSHDDPASYTDALLGAVLLLRNIYDDLEKQVYLPEGLPHDF